MGGSTGANFYDCQRVMLRLTVRNVFIYLLVAFPGLVKDHLLLNYDQTYSIACDVIYAHSCS